MGTKKASESRTRNYATVVYPESAPENWQQILEEMKIPCFISPLHDRDKNANGEDKKAHYHVFIMFDSVKTKDQANDIFEKIGGVGCEVVNSARGMARYLCHLDNPDKAQYQKSDVIQFGGADYFQVIGTAGDKLKCIREMLQYIEENDIRYFSDLLNDCSVNHDDWFDALVNNCGYVIKEFIKSRAYKIEKQSKVNGEIEYQNEILENLEKEKSNRIQELKELEAKIRLTKQKEVLQ